MLFVMDNVYDKSRGLAKAAVSILINLMDIVLLARLPCPINTI